jgi:hypothetical protein
VCCCCLIVYLKPEAPFKWHLAVLAIGIAVPTAAFALEAGTREASAKEIPVPTAGVSPLEQSLIGAPLQPIWNDHPKDAAAWKAARALGFEVNQALIARADRVIE